LIRQSLSKRKTDVFRRLTNFSCLETCSPPQRAEKTCPNALSESADVIRSNSRIAQNIRARQEILRRHEAELQQIDRLLMRTKEVAELFGVTRQTVYRWANAGLLDSFDGGELGLLFDAEEVKSFVPPMAVQRAHRSADG